MTFVAVAKIDDHGVDLPAWVELRGFDSLTPSMRTLGGEVVRGRWRSLGQVRGRWQSEGVARSLWRCCISVLYDWRLNLSATGGQRSSPPVRDTGITRNRPRPGVVGWLRECRGRTSWYPVRGIPRAPRRHLDRRAS